MSLKNKCVPPKDSSILINALLIHHYKRGAYYPKGATVGVPPKDSSILINALLIHHYKRGAYYPKGATVGVPPKDSSILINALLIHHYKRGAYYPKGGGSEIAFHIIRTIQKYGGKMDAFFALNKEEAPDNIPMMFITMPSAKDPESKIRHPGKSCMTILTMVKYEWFEEWKDTSVCKRGDEYYNYKMRFAKNLFDWACTLFPKIKDKLLFQDVATPLTNNHYLGAQHGAMYSAEHNLDRFQAETVARNRCNTPVKNLYISGQDVFSCGIAGALHGGLLCASVVLDHIVYIDLLFLKKKLKRRKARELAELSKKKLQ
ncbi:hypothetical protein KUCAC02_027386 [Chaenocephalus aceratus]|uniref:Uncharacterized protein n=1 Tax=Chaenocephalus aceratus TaxID=36190 RepID=A0ACB9W4C1_CHAAC|nr:hypothetical protein KUCAC02_027386 [Chaenocephalus aceratus]